MKNLLLLLVFMVSSQMLNAQLVHCRPQLCVIDYNYHDDRSANADMTAIKNALPEILIDNTPSGYWGQKNGGVGCLPSQYTPLGIKVYSYITGGYEGTKYQTTEDNLISNLARINAIASDGATGVFLDEVSSLPNTAAKAYIYSIDSACKAKGLKLIVNPGTSTFDSWLMGNCDLLMSDEHYNGTRPTTPSESPYLDRILVVAQNITNTTDAAKISLGARANGFGYSYACNLYTALPTWLSNYISQITQPPTKPTIALSGNTLKSDAPCGNQWYEKSLGKIAGATNQTFTPKVTGSYYDTVTLTGCSSDSSNTIRITSVSISNLSANNFFTLSPNPAKDFVEIKTSTTGTFTITVAIYNMLGQLVKNENSVQNNQPINISDLADGEYILKIRSNELNENIKLILQR